MKLSKREKILLSVLACLAVVFIGWRVLLTPAMEKYSAQKQKVEDLKVQMEQMNLTAGSQQELQDKLKKAMETMESESYFYRNLSVADADRLLSSIAEKNKVTIKELSVDEVTASEVSPFVSGRSVLMDSLLQKKLQFDKDAQQQYAADAELIQRQVLLNQATGSDPLTVPLYTCKMNVTGSSANLAAMLAAINQSGHSMYVAKVTTTNEILKNKYIENIDSDGVFSGIVTVLVYFINE